MPEDQSPTTGDLGEDALVGKITQLLGKMPSHVQVGAGDDCAVITPTSEEAPHLLLKVDAIVEGAHYSVGEDPKRVGRKALCRALSDIAAMGGKPLAALITLATPASTPVSTVEQIYEGLTTAGEEFSTPIVGGETTSLPQNSPTLLSITLLGEAATPLLRSGGKCGDVLYVTGVLGGSFASEHHLDFFPRLAEGQWLAQQTGVHALMDLSDGLASDLPRLSAASTCSHSISPDLLPLRTGSSIKEALEDGEDYELLIAIDPSSAPAVVEAWQQNFPNLALTRIGEFIAKGESPQGETLAGGNGWDTFRDAP